MLSFSNRGGITFPHIHLKPAINREGAFYKRLVSVRQSAAVVAVAAGMFFVAYGIHAPWPINGSNGSAGAYQSSKDTTNLITSDPDTCSADDEQHDEQFTACPGFVINYAGQPNGSIGNGIFNIYAGAPVANDEAQYYLNSHQNIRIENGSLVLTALNQQNHGYKYSSARIDTHGKEDFLYGKMVVRAKIPNGIGTWPSIWLLPSQSKYEKLSPVSDSTRYLNDGEIDIAEAVGTEPNVVYGIAHSLAYPEDGKNHAYFNTMTVPGNDKAFHDYELDWTPTKLTFSIDGKPYFIYSKKPNADYHSWPFDQPFYLVMNLALGGDWGGTDTAQFPGDGVDKTALPAALKVQSIRYYSFAGPQ
ncbi:MAG TPA: glycoside hydrolase family 16 protein [Candidatus Saccharimonadales bacterium]|nr:glycoside hydrolase family 16 protein [Candidatus Saccharimonadales bacterium]